MERGSQFGSGGMFWQGGLITFPAKSLQIPWPQFESPMFMPVRQKKKVLMREKFSAGFPTAGKLAYIKTRLSEGCLNPVRSRAVTLVRAQALVRKQMNPS